MEETPTKLKPQSSSRALRRKIAYEKSDIHRENDSNNITQVVTRARTTLPNDVNRNSVSFHDKDLLSKQLNLRNAPSRNPLPHCDGSVDSSSTHAIRFTNCPYAYIGRFLVEDINNLFHYSDSFSAFLRRHRNLLLTNNTFNKALNQDVMTNECLA